MRKVTAVVEIADNNLSAYLKEVDGVIAVGHTVEELKSSMEESIMLFIETVKECELELPEILSGEYEVVFKYDLASFLNAYAKVLSKSGLEHLTGINQKQLWHYASGISKPKKSTVEKVATSVHALGRELMNIEFA